MKEEIQSMKYESVNDDVFDSDTEDVEQSKKLLKSYTRSMTPATKPPVAKTYSKEDLAVTVAPGNNKKYPDVPIFDGDKSKWDGWWLHLFTKFRESAVLYPTERNKIDYIRDHYGETPFKMIRAGFMDPKNGKITGDYYHYHIAQDVIDLLDNSYGSYNPIANADAELHNPDFIIKNDKTFDSFLVKFIVTIAPLDLIESSYIGRPPLDLPLNYIRYRLFI